MINAPKPVTWGALTRATDEEYRKFRRALNMLFFTRDEFVAEGPSVIFRKYEECLSAMKYRDEQAVK